MTVIAPARIAKLEPGGDLDVVFGVESNALAVERLEAGRLHFDAVGSDRHLGQDPFSFLIGDGVAHAAAFSRGRGDLGVGGGRARRVGNRTVEAAGDFLGGERRGQEESAS